MSNKLLLIAILLAPCAFAAGQEEMLYYRDGVRIDPAEVYRVLARPGLKRSLRLLPDASPDAFTAAVREPGLGTRLPLTPVATAPAAATVIAQPAAPAARAPSRAEPESIALPVQFGFDSADILPHARAQLDAVAEGIKMLPEASRVLIEGHTDSTGPDEYNLQLSRKRAEAVKQYLVNSHGVTARRLLTAGFGETRPLSGNEAAAPENRRVQFRGA